MGSIWDSSGNNAANKGLDMRRWGGILVWSKNLGVGIAD
jgi:hypothetical protein